MVAKGTQGHNKGDKESKGQFKTVAPTVPKPPTVNMISKKETRGS